MSVQPWLRPLLVVVVFLASVSAPFPSLGDAAHPTAWAQAEPVPVDAALTDARDQRSDLAEERALIQAALPPDGSILVLQTSRLSASVVPQERDAALGAAFLAMLRHVRADEVGAFAARYAAEGEAADDVVFALGLIEQHVMLEASLKARIAVLDARIAALDDRIRRLEASQADAPSTFDWDLTGTWHAERTEEWGAAHLDDERATLTVGSLARHDLPTLRLEIENVHFVPGWRATLMLRPRLVDVLAMLDGGPLTTIHPVGSFDGPHRPLSPAKEHSEPEDRVDHHCEAWNEPGGIGRVTVVDPGGTDERLELTLRFEAVHCDDGVPVDVFLTFER